MKSNHLVPIHLESFFLVATLACAAALAQPEIRETFPARSPAQVEWAGLEHQRRELHAWLVGRQIESGLEIPLIVDVAAEEWRERPNGSSRNSRIKVGVAKPVGVDFDFPETAKSLRSFRRSAVPYGALKSRGGGGYVWTAAVRSEGARALRIRFTDFELPAGAELYVYNQTGQAFGPYTGLGPLDEGEFWSHTVFGPELIVQLHYTRPAHVKSSPPGFQIAEVDHLGSEFELAPHPEAVGDQGACHDGQGDGCLYNVNCTSPDATVQAVQDAAALILFQSGGFLYLCSGGLLNDTDDSSFKPFLLTANHCISQGREARSAEAFFQFEVGCQESCTSRNDPSVPSVTGASLLSTSQSTDHTLLLLDKNAPAGSVFLGWTATGVAFSDGEPLFRVSHPRGLPQAYSEHLVDTGAPTCSSWPRGSRIYSRDELGSTEGGSSGSPVVNLTGQVVGQLSGACGYNVNDSCDSSNNATVDGAFAAYYGSVSQWLAPASGGGGGGCQLGENGDSCSADNQCCSGKCRGKKVKTCR